MNFLLRTAAVAALFAVSGCGSAFYDPDAARDTLVYDAAPDVFVPRDGVPSDSPISAQCLTDASSATGSGQVRASVQIDSRLTIARTEIWVAAMCLDSPAGEQASRVVWLDPGGGDTTIAGLAPGRYAVRTSTLTVPSVRSNEVIVTSGSVAATLLALANGPGPIALARAALAPRGGDGGVVFPDATSADGGSLGRLEVPIVDPAMGREPIGTLVVELLARDASSFDLNAQVRVSCPACRVTVDLASIEARLSRAGQPAGIAVATFMRPTLTPGLATSVMQPMTLPGRVGDAELELTLVLFGTVQPMR